MAEAREGGIGWPRGVEPVDHTADVGLRVRADTLASLFERTAAGMCTLIEGEDGAEARAGESGGCTLTLESDDVSSLLVAWLRELLYRHQVERAAFAGATFLRLAWEDEAARHRGVACDMAPKDAAGVVVLRRAQQGEVVAPDKRPSAAVHGGFLGT